MGCVKKPPSWCTLKIGTDISDCIGKEVKKVKLEEVSNSNNEDVSLLIDWVKSSFEGSECNDTLQYIILH